MDRTLAIAIGVGTGGIIIGGAVVVASFVARSHSTETSVETPVVQHTDPPPPVKKEKTLSDEQTLADAMRFVSPSFGQTKNGEHSAAAIAITAWSIGHLRWTDVGVTTDETSFALARKNIDDARGKKLCVSGSIIEITESKLDQGRMSEGLIQSWAGNLFSFLGVGSSGAIVQGSTARFCGVVVDAFDYANSGGGTGHAIDVVGMFDIPENRNRVWAVPVLPRETSQSPHATPSATHASTPQMTTTAPVATTVTVAPTASDDCAPPYTLDATGHKVWKRGCM
jgi:hypothetical protein